MSYRLQDLFDDNEIRNWTSGKNCSPGWVNISCPFCNDKTNHCGCNIDSGKYNCWKCGSTGFIIHLLEDILHIPINRARKILDEYKIEEKTVVKKEKIVKEFSDILPKQATKDFPDVHKEYLLNKGFDPAYVTHKYSLETCHIDGDFKWRIIIPILFKGKIVNFSAISVVGANLKVKNCPNDKAIIERHNLLYNYDNIENRKVLVVEGFADTWRMGDSCVATMGTKFTDAQVNLIIEAADHVCIMYDSEAKDPQAPIQAEKLANKLYGFVKQVEVLYLDKGDPGDLTEAEALEIRKIINI